MKKTTGKSKKVELKNITESFKGKKIVLAPQNKVKKDSDYVDQILKALGSPEALVTDESAIFDWTFLMTDKEICTLIKKASKKLGVAVNPDDYIVDIIEKMKLAGK